MPNLETFRTLRVIASLQNAHGKSPTQVAIALKEEAVQSLLEDNMAAWEKAARGQFSALLGYPHYYESSTDAVHPTERLTALFKCTSCCSKGTRTHPAVALDFWEACRHVCRPSSGAKRMSWSYDNFELDQEVRGPSTTYVF